MTSHHDARRGAALICGLLAVLCGAATAAAESYTVDTVHSSVLFRIKHLNTSYAWGRFNEIAGILNLDQRNPSLDVQVKTESIDTANAKRDQHLKGPDFFSAKQFPMIGFKSTKITKTDQNKLTVDGTLSLHGMSRPMRVDLLRTGSAKNQQGANIAGFEAVFDIKRSDFGMKFMLEGLGDDVKLIVSLECAQQ